MIKQLLGCRHLLSHKPNGVTIQIYLAIIACIIIMSITGKSPTKRTYEMISFYLIGWATLDELEEHIKKLSDKVVNLAFDDNAKTVPNTIGWKPIPLRVVRSMMFAREDTDGLEVRPTWVKVGAAGRTDWKSVLRVL